MKILAIGDIVGVRAIEHLRQNLWKLRDKLKLDLVIANGENATEIHGLSANDARAILDCGVDLITMGNHTWSRRDLYDFLDNSKLFKATVDKKDRSLMNVPFVTGNEELDAKFVKEAKAAGFENLKGHRSVGGMRASIYNAMPKAGVEALVEFMKKFEAENA